MLMKSRAQLEAVLAGRMLPIARRWRALADRALDGLDVSSSLAWTLIQVGRMGGEARQTDLARALEISDPSLVRILDQLAKDDLLTRAVDAGDRRVRRVALTEAGRALVLSVEEVLASLRRRLLGDVADGELATAVSVLERIGDAVAPEETTDG